MEKAYIHESPVSSSSEGRFPSLTFSSRFLFFCLEKSLIRDFFLESGAAAPADGGPFRLNYFSGTGTHVYPLTVASGLKNIYQGTNEVVFEFGGGCLGVTIFDFVGEDAVAHVVAQQVWGLVLVRRVISCLCVFFVGIACANRLTN